MKIILKIIVYSSLLSVLWSSLNAQDTDRSIYVDTTSYNTRDTINRLIGTFDHLELKNKTVIYGISVNLNFSPKKAINLSNVNTKIVDFDARHGSIDKESTFHITELYAQSLRIRGPQIDCPILLLFPEVSDMIFFSGSFNKAVSLIAGSANEIYMRESNFGDTLRLNGIEIAEDLDLDKITLPNYLELAQLDVGGLIHLNGTSLNRDMEENKKKCVIELFGIPVDKISFSFENFELYTPDKPDISQFDDYNQIFENLIKKFTASGQLSSLEEVTKQHKRYKYLKDPTQNKYLGMFMNFVNREWNDYGYSKVRIWLWTGGFFIFFWLINWLRFPHIYIHAYSTPSLANAVETRNYNTKAARRNFFNFRALDLSLYYTAIIFFGLKIESANFNFNNRRGVLYIAGQYIVGIICLAYLANFIIVK